MKKEDWLAAGMVALSVSLAVVALGLPPAGWAQDPVPVAIPALPPAELKIPSEGVTVTATTERQPGEVVIVRLSCECSAGHNRLTVPLVIHVFKFSPMEMMSRVAMPTPPSELAKVECSCPIDSEGKGFTVVKLPLMWTSEDASGQEGNAPQQANVAPKQTKGPRNPFMVRYSLSLTSPLTPAQVTVPPPVKAAAVNSQRAK
jgi:hypothetical protein